MQGGKTWSGGQVGRRILSIDPGMREFEFMQEISFTASEYQPDQSFLTIDYRYVGSPEKGWTIEREGRKYLGLGPGYVPVRTSNCGICATDLARHKLPFPLPQITGHEVTGHYQGKRVAIEINASHLARGLGLSECLYCRNQLDTHCPDRMTLGIDRLPGGFSPWVLAPVKALHELPNSVSDTTGVLIEPFAAALRAVMLSPPQQGDRVAVLGPRRLGMLLIAALHSFRQQHTVDFEIVALMRHPRLQTVAENMGADWVVKLGEVKVDDIKQTFDTVFDTTGSIDGFALAAKLTGRTLHLKSTNGQAYLGVEHLTSMVINEQGMIALNKENLSIAKAASLDWPGKIPVYMSPAIRTEPYSKAFDESYEVISDLPKEDDAQCNVFDMALVSSIEEINQLTQARSLQGQALLRARGLILMDPASFQVQPDSVWKDISQGRIELSTSRCGRFADVIELMRQQTGLTEKLEKYLVSDKKSVKELAEAFQLAANSDKSIKLVIETGET